MPPPFTTFRAAQVSCDPVSTGTTPVHLPCGAHTLPSAAQQTEPAPQSDPLEHDLRHRAEPRDVTSGAQPPCGQGWIELQPVLHIPGVVSSS
jgi:hypothetical protein